MGLDYISKCISLDRIISSSSKVRALAGTRTRKLRFGIIYLVIMEFRE